VRAAATEFWRKAGRGDRATLVGALLATILLIVGLEARNPPAAKPIMVSTHGLEARLAALQLEHHPGRRNPLLQRFAYQLDILQADCPDDTRQELGSMVLKTIATLRRDGISVTPNAVLGGVVGLPDMGTERHCSTFFARYVEQQRRAG
jgi:hypothetical protein